MRSIYEGKVRTFEACENFETVKVLQEHMDEAREMDSRLRGIDTDVACNPPVIPAKAGIHADVVRMLNSSHHCCMT
jgi:hypothetical protein